MSVLSIGITPCFEYRVVGSRWRLDTPFSLSSCGSQPTSLIHRFRHDWSVVTANSALIAATFFFSATISPVRYSAKCFRSGSLANTEPYSFTASLTIVGYSMMAGMERSLSRPPYTLYRHTPSSLFTSCIPVRTWADMDCEGPPTVA